MNRPPPVIADDQDAVSRESEQGVVSPRPSGEETAPQSPPRPSKLDAPNSHGTVPHT